MVTTMSSQSWESLTYQTVRATNAARAPRLMAFFPGSISGEDFIRADSFRNATIEPVKVTAPMKTPMNTSAWWTPSGPGQGGASRCPFQPTRTAARPTKLCSRAMSSGMPVISTTRARQSPMAPPTSTAATSRTSPVRAWSVPQASCRVSQMVAARAMTMPGDAVDDPGLGLLVLAQSGEAEDEQQGRDDVGRPGDGVGGQRTGDGVRHG
jgi:hypothetical protein